MWSLLQRFVGLSIQVLSKTFWFCWTRCACPEHTCRFSAFASRHRRFVAHEKLEFYLRDVPRGMRSLWKLLVLVVRVKLNTQCNLLLGCVSIQVPPWTLTTKSCGLPCFRGSPVWSVRDKYIERELALLGTHCTFTLTEKSWRLFFSRCHRWRKDRNWMWLFCACIPGDRNVQKNVRFAFRLRPHIADLETSVQIKLVIKSDRKLVVWSTSDGGMCLCSLFFFSHVKRVSLSPCHFASLRKKRRNFSWS